MKNDIAKIRKTDKIVIKSDKTGNCYCINVNNYPRSFCEEVNKIYKNVSLEQESDIHCKAEITTNELKIDGRGQKRHKQQASMTVL